MAWLENILEPDEAPTEISGANLPHRLGTWLLETLIAERGRWFLWAPVCLAAGASFYFSLQFEPTRLAGWICAGCFLLMWIACRVLDKRHLLEVIVAAFLLTSIGFCAAKEKTLRVTAPMLVHSTGPVMVTGRVAEVELADQGPRVVLDKITLPGLVPEATPDKIRIRLTRYSSPPVAGSIIMLRAVLMSPAGPAEPEAHDFRRDAFFNRIGGVGYAVGKPSIVEASSFRPGEEWLERLRQTITAKILEAMGRTPEAAIAAAYLTGERGLIEEQTANDMRNSGLAHLLAISGMKVGLVAILSFAVFRTVIALFPALALRLPARKIAATGAILVAFAYTGLAAAPIPALRSVLMTGMGMFAILFNRQAFSLRLAAIAAAIVILWQPESVTGVSFQMSFGAVIALIAFYEAFRLTLSSLYQHSTRARRVMLAMGRIVVTTLVATLVTSPLALFHFQQEANYSAIANAGSHSIK